MKVKAGSEIVNPTTGYIGLARCDVPMSEPEYLGDEDGGPWRFRIKRRWWQCDTRDVEFSAEEIYGDPWSAVEWVGRR